MILDCNVFEEMQEISLMDDQQLNHVHCIFQTNSVKLKRNYFNFKTLSMILLQAWLRIVFFHILNVVYFHEQKNPICIMEFFHVLDHENHEHINAFHQPLGSQQ